MVTYQHKKGTCAKDTRQILSENVLELKETEYDLIKTPEAVQESKTEKRPNFLTREDPPEQDSIETDLEEYHPAQEVKMRVVDAKENIEKKKKKRNYIEFREDY